MDDKLQGRAAHSAAIRERAEAEMKLIGIDDLLIGALVEAFYARGLSHPQLGPVFDARLAGRWPEHIEKMKSFWSGVAFRSGAYGGKPVQAHLGVANMTPELFRNGWSCLLQRWTKSFRQRKPESGLSQLLTA